MQRGGGSLHTSRRTPVITATLVLLAVVAGVALLWPRRGSAHPSDLGTISETWLSEVRASERP